MKTKNLTLLFLLFSSFLFGQSPDHRIAIEDKEFNAYFFNEAHIPSVKGRILNLTKEDVAILKVDYTLVTPFEQKQISKATKLNPDGSFELELDFAFPYQQVWLSIGELYNAAIFANTDLLIELDATLLKAEGGRDYIGPGIRYLGTDGLLNTYMNNRVLFERKEQQNQSRSIRRLKRNKRLSPEQFVMKYDSIYSILNQLDDRFIKQNPSEYSWMVKNERQSDYYNILFVRHWGKEMQPSLFEKANTHKAYLTSNAGMGFYYAMFTYLKNLPGKDSKSDISITERTIRLVTLLDSLFEYPKSDFLKVKFSSKDPTEHKQMLELVLSSMQTAWTKHIVQQQYEATVEKIASINKVLSESKPMIADYDFGKAVEETKHGAMLYKVDSLDAQELLSNLKHSFENRAMLLDFWATWCRPCLEEMPHSRALYQEAQGLPVEFIYLCTSSGSSVDKWKSKIVEYELSGIHLFVEKDIEKELMDFFSVNGYPSYVFINPKGEFKSGAIRRVSKLNKEKLIELIEE